jgi:hypothetical protein
LASQFAEAVFAGPWRARLIGADAFKETGQTRRAMYFWAELQAHRALQGYIELGFIAQPEVSSVVVDHLLQKYSHGYARGANKGDDWTQSDR